MSPNNTIQWFIDDVMVLQADQTKVMASPVGYIFRSNSSISGLTYIKRQLKILNAFLCICNKIYVKNLAF